MDLSHEWISSVGISSDGVGVQGKLSCPMLAPANSPGGLVAGVDVVDDGGDPAVMEEPRHGGDRPDH